MGDPKDRRRAVLDAMTVEQIETYLKDRRRRERLALGAVDGWQRTPMDIEMPMKAPCWGVTIQEGSWIWRDPEGRIRRAFCYLGSSYEAAMTFDTEGNDLASWELRDDDDLIAAVGSYDALNLTSPEHLALIRASVSKAPIDRGTR